MTTPIDDVDDLRNPFLNESNDAKPQSSSSPPSRSNLDGYRDSSGNFHSFQQVDLDRPEPAVSALEDEILPTPPPPPPSPSDKNFPPLLRWWSWHPERDLPVNAIPIFTKLRILFIALFPLYLLNFGGCLAIILAPARANTTSRFSGSTAGRVVMAAIFAVVCVPLSFHFSFFLMYKGVANSAALQFFGGLIVYGIWFVMLAFAVVGFSWSGSIGLVMTIEAFAINYGVAIVGFIFCVGGAACIVAMGFGFVALVKYYRENGLIAKAKEEGVTMAVRYAKEEQAAQIVNG